MKKMVFFILFSTAFCNSYTQTSLPDTFRRYFNYDTLKNFTCEQMPVGIYSLSFKIDQRHAPSDIHFSQDSLPILKNLFVSALQKTATYIHLQQSDKPYLLLIYYNSFMNCINTTDKPSDSNNLWRAVAMDFNRQMELTEKSFGKIFSSQKEYIVLEPILINDENPNRPKSLMGFPNDCKIAPTASDKEKIENAVKEIEKLKKEKAKEN